MGGVQIRTYSLNSCPRMSRNVDVDVYEPRHPQCTSGLPSLISFPITMLAFPVFSCLVLAIPGFAAPGYNHGHGRSSPVKRISLGPRPYWLVDNMDEGPLKRRLASCSEKEMKRSDWSISHRGGGTLQFPEHTYESIMAGVSPPLRTPDRC